MEKYIESMPEVDLDFQPDFDELTPPYMIECPVCGEGPFESLAEEKAHAKAYHTKPVSKFREYMDGDMGFFENLPDPAEYVPEMAEGLIEQELVNLPHTRCTVASCKFHRRKHDK